MKKYYLFFAFLFLLTGALSISYLASKEKRVDDKKTAKVLREVAGKVEEYVRTNKAIPENLNEVTDIAKGQPIAYKKLDKKTYELCATYKYSSEDTGEESFLGIGMPDETYSNYSAASVASEYSYYKYKAGRNCYKGEPYLPEDADGIAYDRLCQFDDAMSGASLVKVARVNKDLQTIEYGEINQYGFWPGYAYSNTTTYYDEKCMRTTLEAVKPGVRIRPYFDYKKGTITEAIGIVGVE
jgi:hypothetical protein